jgi:diguanylate cyclase (GGDEF)-like protein
MSRQAWLYIWSTFLLGLVLIAQAIVAAPPAQVDWLLLGLLITAATFSQLYRAEGQSHWALFTTPIFLFAGLLLLPPAQFYALVAIPHLVEWLKARLEGSKHLSAWYIQPFNIAMHIIAGAAAHWVYSSFLLTGQPLPDFAEALKLLAMAATYLLVNQLLLGQAFVLARGKTWRESRVLALDNLTPEFLMLCIGISVAFFWQVNPWLLPCTLAPLSLIYRALMVPKLKEEAETDGKTGLYNARYFRKLYEEEFARAQRFQRPMSFIMADLDFLRTINNTYGHLAGDAVLEGIGKIIRKNVREYDLAGRFGGEEFAIVLPETAGDQAVFLAERIRRAIEETGFEVDSSPTPIKATMSFGIASFPEDAATVVDLNHRADEAVYQAKFLGRNRVFRAADLPQYEKLGVNLEPAQETSPAASGEPVAIAVGSAAPLAPQLPAKPEAAPHPAPARSAAPPDAPAHQKAAVEVAGVFRAAKARARFPQTNLPLRLKLLVALVITLGLGVTFVSIPAWPRADLLALALMVTIALVTELRQISVYGDNSTSASLTGIVAAGLLGGVPGVVAASAAIALADQIRQRRPAHEFYKVLYNWATHVLSGTPLVLLFQFSGIPLQVEQLLPLLLLAVGGGGLYYVIESLLISAAISIAKGARLTEIWKYQMRWLSVHYLALSVMGLFLALAYTTVGLFGVVIVTLPALMMGYAQKQYVSRTQDSVRELRRMNQELTNANREIQHANNAIQQLNDELFETLARFYDKRDPYTGGHSAKVADYATAIGKELKLSPERIRQLRQAALLHDIGKIAVSEAILFKPAKLTAEEYEVIKRHPVTGAKLLEISQGLRHLAPFVRHHHERWDGKGYPDGLRAEEIPLEARILNLCDAAEAMASDRPYSRAMSLETILEEVRRNAGTQFDPAIAAVFITIAERELEVVNSAQLVLGRLEAIHQA